MSADSTKKFEEALQLLNEAAKDKKDEIQRLLSDKYTNIKDAIENTVDENRDRLNRLRKVAGETLESGQEKIEEVIEDVDKRVRKNPWPYIGGVAVGALLLGYILGSSKQK